jgi:hypothetical protein
MDSLGLESLIGIRGIQCLKPEQGTVVCSQGIFSIPDRDLIDLVALDYINYTDISHRKDSSRVNTTVNYNYCTLFIISEKKSNVKSKCRPPPAQSINERRP